MALTGKQRDKLVQDTVKKINRGIYDNIKSLEQAIADIVAQGGDPITVRPQIVAAFEQHAANTVENVDVKEVAERQIIGTRTVEDEKSMDALTSVTKDSIRAGIASGAEDIMKTLVIGGAAGVATGALVKQVRGRVSGIFMDSSNPEVRKAQTALKAITVNLTKDATPAEIAQLKRVIKDRLQGINITSSVRDLTSKNVQDAVMQFDGAFMKGQFDRKEVKYFRYEGGLVATSREFCMEHQGNVYTEDEIYNIWAGGSWAGQIQGDPFIVRGGYNCNHFWVPVDKNGRQI